MTGNPKKDKRKSKSALKIVKSTTKSVSTTDTSKKRKDSTEKKDNKNLSIKKLLKGVLADDRGILARVITIIESGAKKDQKRAQEILKELTPHSGRSIRIGITGMPGAGKSTFIDALGVKLTARNHKVAVLAVDPSSSLTKGSILGDKTRMENLSRDANAFIRPSPSGGTLGGVSRKTRESIIVFEAAGYDVILVETIGVGQNEIAVRSMVDFFLLILIAGAGDELQGIKRGIMEIADAIVINKADGDNIKRAENAREEFERALHYFQPVTEGWQPKAITVSALHDKGIDPIWDIIKSFEKLTEENGTFRKRRRNQLKNWLHDLISNQLQNLLLTDTNVRKTLPELEKLVIEGKLPAAKAAEDIIKRFLK
ncbi:MAG: methylmalonyl Co-A mutase-associated GTPase MeaB [candidate division Zixibacteria bacterium]